jgi:hydrogenase maturation factor HypF (carbamoyltransferase family)
LLEKLIKLYSKSEFDLFFQQQVPANDGGIALGQVMIGAKMREKL